MKATSPTVVALVAMLASASLATQDRIPTPVRIERSYVVEPPIGRLDVGYERSIETGEQTLRVTCGLCRATVGPAALANMPANAAWDEMRVSYLLGSRDAGPAYVVAVVPIRTRFEAGEISVHFVFRMGEPVERSIWRYVGNALTTFGWPLDSKLTLDETIAAPATRPAK